MERININLLPPEFRAEQVKKIKFYKAQMVGVAVILTMFFLASLTVSLRLLQNYQIKQAQVQLVQAEQKVLDVKEQQTQLMLLKNRLAQIEKFLGVTSKQTTLYNLIASILPESLTVSTISVDKAGVVSIVAVAPSVQTLDDLVSKLTQKETNEDKIQSLSIDTLSRGREGVYRVSLTVQPK